MVFNSVMIIGLVLMSISIGVLLMRLRLRTARDFIDKLEANELDLSQEGVILYVKEKMHEKTRENLLDRGYGEEEYQKKRKIRNKLKLALRSCKHGDLKDKEIVKDHLFGLVSDYLGQETSSIINFDQMTSLSGQDMFDVLLFIYKTRRGHGYRALSVLIDDHGLAGEKRVIEDGITPSYIVTKEEIKGIFMDHFDEVASLSHRERLLIISQRIYQYFKGHGVIDEIRDMEVDGVSGGVSGELSVSNSKQSIEDYVHQVNLIPKHYDSIWIMLGGKSIHLAFLSFGSDNELRRVCQNIYSYNKAGQLSESTGYKINEMKDGSRVVVVRPPFSESWAFFVRKFNLSDKKLEDLIDHRDLIDFLKFLVKGARITSITGAQGSGKTTLLMALVRDIYASLPIRVQETAFELHLRNIYPYRNILTFKETDYVSGQDGLDVQKKTDGAVNILGEVASDPVASWMIQMAQVASLFTIFTHHAKTASDLVMALRNSMLRTKTFSNEKIAEKQVAEVLDFDIHLEKDRDGKRYISRITEIKVTKTQDYPMTYMEASDSLGAAIAFYETQTEFFRRMTDRKTFETRDIVRYDKGTYVFCNKPSKDNLDQMRFHMKAADRIDFDRHLSEVFE